MPRPKGSKNKVVIIENVDEKIAAVNAEIERLKADLKAKKDELKTLNKAKLQADKAAAARKAEEDKAKLLEAIEKSGAVGKPTAASASFQSCQFGHDYTCCIPKPVIILPQTLQVSIVETTCLMDPPGQLI